jgi:hypothetical protein
MQYALALTLLFVAQPLLAAQINSTVCTIGVRSLHEFNRWSNLTVDPYINPEEVGVDDTHRCDQDATPICHDGTYNATVGECQDDDGNSVGPVTYEHTCYASFDLDWTGEERYCNKTPDSTFLNEGEAYRISLGDVNEGDPAVHSTDDHASTFDSGEKSDCTCNVTVEFVAGFGDDWTFTLSNAANQDME